LIRKLEKGDEQVVPVWKTGNRKRGVSDRGGAELWRRGAHIARKSCMVAEMMYHVFFQYATIFPPGLPCVIYVHLSCSSCYMYV